MLIGTHANRYTPANLASFELIYARCEDFNYDAESLIRFLDARQIFFAQQNRVPYKHSTCKTSEKPESVANIRKTRLLG